MNPFDGYLFDMTNGEQHISQIDDEIDNEIDNETADRMLSGLVHADDAPPGFSHVAEAVATLRLGADSITASPEAGFISLLTTHVLENNRRSRMKHSRLSTAVAASIGALSLVGGLAAAGALPSAISNAADNALSGLGIASNASSADRPTTTTVPDTTSTTSAASHGSSVSDLAKGTELEGREKGGAIASIASGGRSNNTGSSGATGTTRTTGPSGATGSSGATGISGVSGPSGVTGVSGPFGPTGPTGFTHTTRR